MQNVEIRVRGMLDPSWSEWLGDLEISYEDDCSCLLKGQITDQATLYGILKKIRDIGLELITVEVKPL